MISYRGSTPRQPFSTQTAKPAPATAPVAAKLYRPRIVPQPAVAPVRETPATVKPSGRTEALQYIFNNEVGPTLEEARQAGYTISYQPASEVDGTVRLHLQVVNPRNWGTLTADIESTASHTFVLRAGNHTSHIPANLLPQGLAVIKHGIIALRPTA